MTSDSVKAPRNRIEGIPADDWQGMYHVAAKRAQEWEDRAKAERWIPVAERLPDYGVTVDVWDSERGRVTDCDRVCLSDAGDVWADIHGEDLRAWNGEDNVTHWRMPPKPPEVKS